MFLNLKVNAGFLRKHHFHCVEFFCRDFSDANRKLSISILWGNEHEMQILLQPTNAEWRHIRSLNDH